MVSYNTVIKGHVRSDLELLCTFGSAWFGVLALLQFQVKDDIGAQRMVVLQESHLDWKLVRRRMSNSTTKAKASQLPGRHNKMTVKKIEDKIQQKRMRVTSCNMCNSVTVLRCNDHDEAAPTKD